MSFHVLWWIHIDVSEKHAACFFVPIKLGSRRIRNMICLPKYTISQCCRHNTVSKRLYIIAQAEIVKHQASGVTWAANRMNNSEMFLSYRCDVGEAECKEIRTVANRNHFALGNYEICYKFLCLQWNILYQYLQTSGVTQSVNAN